MTDDPMVREPHQRPPLLPWTQLRFRWPDPGDREVERLRGGMPDRGHGLYLLKAPYGEDKLLVEAYYPDEIADHYARGQLDRWRTADLTQGRLVVIHVHEDIKNSDERLDETHLQELRRNARNLRAGLRRQSSPRARKRELEDAREAEEAVVYDRFIEFWGQAMRDTREYALKPHVGPARGTHLGGGGI